MNAQNTSAGILSALMACTGGAMMVITAAQRLELTTAALVSWLFIVYVFGGGLNLWLTLHFKIPFAGAHSITAAAFLSTSAMQVSLPELVGSYLMAGAIIAVLGLTGIFNKLLELIPRPLIDAMLAGLILHYVVDIVPVFQQSPLVAGLAILGFFLTPRLSKALPPLLGVLVFGLIGLFIVYRFPEAVPIPFSLPQFVVPQFSAANLLSLALPLAILVISNDLAVALAALKKNGFDPPANKTIVASGIGTVMASFFGGQALNIGGMMTALCSSEEAGEKSQRYKAAIVSSVLVILFGLFSWKLIVLIQMLPGYFIALLTGFSLVGVLLGSLQSAFKETQFKYSVLFAFVISIANVSFFGISSAVWSLLIGALAAKLLKEGNEKVRSV
ncbi:benzoate/H(+) symporter BenE family transporter [Paenibacillus sp. GXUN7292]|uniref:benzoate/H(+) symporter BenE family transporter n=1 Tax=Paenibacillus sp. GXUN7292 TaxID=3422499 RepID=UPI003D7EBE68